jgi:VanZ family protein
VTVTWLARYGSPVAWMGLIAFLSGDLFAAEHTGAWLLPVLQRLLPTVDRGGLDALHAVIRKLAHVIEYGILAALWRRALAPAASAPWAGWWALLLAASYAVVDETRQGLAPSRTPSALDVAIDTAGALLAVACLERDSGPARFARTLARWAAVGLALASAGAGALDWTLGLRAGDLAITAVAAAIAAWALARRPTGSADRTIDARRPPGRSPA